VTVATYRVHRLIQDLFADPVAASAFRENAEPVFNAYGLNEGERRLLREGSPAALETLGVHPNLKMKFFRIRVPPASDTVTHRPELVDRLMGPG
jgi:hypothetical protein